MGTLTKKATRSLTVGVGVLAAASISVGAASAAPMNA